MEVYWNLNFALTFTPFGTVSARSAEVGELAAPVASLTGVTKVYSSGGYITNCRMSELASVSTTPMHLTML